MTWHERIETKPGVLTGKPVVKGTRIAVELVVELLAQGWEASDILQEYPALGRDRRAGLSALCQRNAQVRAGLLVDR